MTLSNAVAPVALLALVACGSTTDLPPLRPVGVVTVEAVPSDRPSGFGAYATGYFFQDRVTEVTSSQSPPNACSSPQPTAISTSGSSTRWISPGASPTLSVVGSENTTARTVPLLESFDGASRVFYANDSLPTTYPGTDTATVTLAGAAGGFPALTMRGRMVENFTAQPVADSGEATGLVVQWTPATQNGTTMQIQLRYKTDASFQFLNQQVVCSVVDDGDFVIPAVLLDGWRNAGVDVQPLARDVLLSRYVSRVYEQGDAVGIIFTTIKKLQTKPGA